MADPEQKGSLMHEKKGLVYRVLDEAGNKIGTPIKASQFYNKPTLKNLELKFKQNEVLRARFAQHIKVRIDMAIFRNNTLENLSSALRSVGISIMARQSNDGRMYGITFIDHLNLAVFNGSDLGRQYSAKAIQERCMIKPEIVQQERPLLSQKFNEPIKNYIDSKRDIHQVKKVMGFFRNTNVLSYWKSC